METEDIQVSRRQEIARIPTSGYIANYDIAKSIVDNAVRSWAKMWELIRRCQLHIQGERPVQFEKLKNRGLDWTSNENFLKATAKIQKLTKVSVANLFKSISLSYVTFRAYDEKTDKDNACQYLKDEGTRSICAMAFGYAFANTLMREQRLADFLNRCEYPSGAYGFVSLLSKEDDWVPDVIHPLDIAFRPRTKPDELETFVVFQTISGKTLWEKWEAKVRGTKKSKNWQQNALEEVLWRTFKGHSDTEKRSIKAGEEWASVFAKYNACSASTIQNTEDITIAKIYYKELNGTFTVVYIPYDDLRNPDSKGLTNGQNTVDGRIFIKNFAVTSRGGKLKLIRETGYTETTFIEDLRGAAKFAVMDSIRYNSTRNSLADKVKLSGSPVFDAGTNQTAAQFKLSVGSAFVIMPNNFSISANQPKFDIQTGLAYLQFEQGQYLRETEHIDADLQGRLSNRPNKSEVQAKAAEVNELNVSNDVIKFSDYSHTFMDMIMAFANSSFTNPTHKAGQTNFFNQIKKQLPDYVKTDDDVRDLIKAIDHFQLLPILGDVQVIMQAISMAQTPYGRNRYQRMLFVAQGMPIEEVNNIVPLIATKSSSYSDDWRAIMENDTFWNSIDMLPYGTDDHIVHLEKHLPKAQQIAEGFKAGRLQPQVAFAYMTNILYHVQAHLELLGRDSSLNAKAQEYLEPFNQLQQAKNQMMLAAQAQQEAQANAQQTRNKDEEEIRRKDQESQAKMQRQDNLQASRTMQSVQSIETKAQLEKYRIDLDAQLKQRELELESNGNQGTVTPAATGQS